MIKRLLLSTILIFTTLSGNTVTKKVKDVSKNNTKHTLKKDKHTLNKSLEKEKRKLKHEKLQMEAKAVSKIL